MPNIQRLSEGCVFIQWTETHAPGPAALAAWAAAWEETPFRGLREIVPAYTSAAVHFDPRQAGLDWVCAELKRRLDVLPETAAARGRTVLVPVCYGGEYGPDLPEVARRLGMSEEEVVRRHAGAAYTVAFLGFAPGFPYLRGLPAELALPRRDTPRLAVPAGSVALAGGQTGIYPLATPGGWHIIGRTPLRLFCPEQDPPVLLRPGDEVRFVPISPAEFARIADATGHHACLAPDGAGPRNQAEPGVHGQAASCPAGGRWLRVLEPGLWTTVQDLGRWGYQKYGISVGGAVDPWTLRIANALVGNEDDAACLEVTMSGPVLEFGHDARVAVCGAEFEAWVMRPGGSRRPLPGWCAVTVRAGERLVLGSARWGARAYVAVDGGVDVQPVLGSRSTDVRAGIGGLGGRPLRAGDLIPVGPPRMSPGAEAGGTGRPVSAVWRRRLLSGPVRLLPGPECGWFSQTDRQRLVSATYTVTGRQDRMGIRLEGPPLSAAGAGGMVSGPVTHGTVQVPPDGQPVVLAADRQPTGGYPRLAQVVMADWAKVAQWRPGQHVRFRWVSLQEALCAMAAWERLVAMVRAGVVYARDGGMRGVR